MSSGLTEIEIFAKIAELKGASEICGKLAWHPRRGPEYRKLLAILSEAAGAMRQAYYWRNYDARWLYIAEGLEQVRLMAGRWLRDSASKDARTMAHPQFVALADMLGKLAGDAQITKTAKTGRLGPILPKPLPEPEIRVGRPVQVISPGGVLLPA
ncbi:MAG TPA: hypothetical protein VKS24_24945 [Bradyrhizobium sp.]|nr:hypothetical protein [Bradyrhizobium sp.]